MSMTGLLVISSAWFAMGIIVGVTAAMPVKRKSQSLKTKSAISTTDSQPKTYYLGDW